MVDNVVFVHDPHEWKPAHVIGPPRYFCACGATGWRPATGPSAGKIIPHVEPKKYIRDADGTPLKQTIHVSAGTAGSTSPTATYPTTAKAVVAGVEREAPDVWVNEGPHEGEDEEADHCTFSWSRCACCQSTLGGARMRCAVIGNGT